MCGIAGQLNFDRQQPLLRPELELMAERLAHCGPDDEGGYVDGNLGPAHRRLSILDARTRRRGYFNMRFIEQLFNEPQRGREVRSKHLRVLLMFELWHRAYIDRRAHEREGSEVSLAVG